MSYVYLKSESQLFTVGFYDPEGHWIAESDHRHEDKAAAKVAMLNGGTVVAAVPKPSKPEFCAEITWAGDRSVGVQDSHATVTCDFDVHGCFDDRRAVREAFAEFFSSIGDGRPGVRFSDECPDCGKAGFENGNCANRSCIRNAPDSL